MKVFQDFEYEIHTNTGNSEAEQETTVITVGKYLGKKTSVVIPDEIEGYIVTDLNSTFFELEELESVTLPKNLERIHSQTFSENRKLKAIHLPSSLKVIDNNAFEDCTSLEEITMSNHVAFIEQLEVCSKSFLNCPKLYDENGFVLLNTILLSYQGREHEIILPDGIVKIAYCAFWNNHSVTSVRMPDSVTTIGERAFYECYNLKHIHFSKEIKKIGVYAFSGCKNIEQLIIPEKLTEIEDNVFWNCKSLKHIRWNTGLKRILNEAFSECNSLEEISFPEKLNLIESSFSFCKNLQKITIPPSVQRIALNSFQYCDSLEDIEILPRPEGSKKLDLERGCFPYSGKMSENFRIKGQYVPSFVAETYTPKVSEKYCQDLFPHWDTLSKELKDIFRKEWDKKISEKVGCRANILRNLVFLKSSAKEMEIYFREGFHLELPELEDYLEYSIKKGNTVETAMLLDYKHKTFSKEYLEQAKTRKELLDIGLELPTLLELREKWNATVQKDHIEIYGYHGKNTVEFLPPSLADGTPIGSIKHPFYNSGTLQQLSLPEGMKEIGQEVFERSSLQEIKIPNTVKKIGTLAFRESQLKEIILPNSLNAVAPGLFWGCEHLEKVFLPDSIREIGENAFHLCVSLVEIRIPDGVTVIPRGAFCRCYKLQKISLPDTITKLDTSCFEQCHELEEIRLPASLLSMGNCVFLQCLNLKKVILPREDITIAELIFDDHPSLEFIGLEGGENLLHKWKKVKNN